MKAILTFNIFWRFTQQCLLVTEINWVNNRNIQFFCFSKIKLNRLEKLCTYLVSRSEFNTNQSKCRVYTKPTHPKVVESKTLSRICRWVSSNPDHKKNSHNEKLIKRTKSTSFFLSLFFSTSTTIRLVHPRNQLNAIQMSWTVIGTKKQPQRWQCNAQSTPPSFRSFNITIVLVLKICEGIILNWLLNKIWYTTFLYTCNSFCQKHCFSL